MASRTINRWRRDAADCLRMAAKALERGKSFEGHPEYRLNSCRDAFQWLRRARLCVLEIEKIEDGYDLTGG